MYNQCNITKFQIIHRLYMDYSTFFESMKEEKEKKFEINQTFLEESFFCNITTVRLQNKYVFQIIIKTLLPEDL